MRRPRESASWNRYLEAERLGRDEEAEAALLPLFTALPRPAPSAGFASRVLARIGPLAPERSIFARRTVRWALAASLVAGGLGFGLLAPMLPPLAALIGPGRLLSGIVALVSDLAVRFASGVALWEQVGAIGATLARAAANPTVVFDVAESLVIDRVGDTGAAERVAYALGIARKNVIQQVNPDYYVDVTVVVGKDHASLKPSR